MLRSLWSACPAGRRVTLGAGLGSGRVTAGAGVRVRATGAGVFFCTGATGARETGAGVTGASVAGAGAVVEGAEVIGACGAGSGLGPCEAGAGSGSGPCAWPVAGAAAKMTAAHTHGIQHLPCSYVVRRGDK